MRTLGVVQWWGKLSSFDKFLKLVGVRFETGAPGDHVQMNAAPLQVYLFLLIAMAFDVQIPSFGLVEALPAIAVSAYILALAGLILASHIQSLENFAGVMNFVIFPCFFLSSSLYPLWQIEESSEVLFWLSSFNPFTHLVELIRFGLHGNPISMTTGVALTVGILLSTVIHRIFKPEI